MVATIRLDEISVSAGPPGAIVQLPPGPFPAGSLLRWDSRVGVQRTGLDVDQWDEQRHTPRLHYTATGTQRPQYNASNAHLGGQPSIDPDSSQADQMTAVGSAPYAAVKRLHDGTGVAVYLALQLIPGKNIFELLYDTTTRALAGGPGIFVSTFTEGKILVTGLTEAGTNWLFNLQPACPPSVRGLLVEHGVTRSPQWAVYAITDTSYILLGSGAYTETPSPNQSSRELAIFRQTGRSPLAYMEVWGNQDLPVADVAAGQWSEFGRSDALLDWIQCVFSRASVATYWDPNAINGDGSRLYEYAVNVPRILADGSIIIERATTNQILYSEQFDQAAWIKTIGSPTVTPNAAIAPDGSLTADRIQLPLSSAVYNNISLAASVRFGAFQQPNGDNDWQIGCGDGLSQPSTKFGGALGGLVAGWQRNQIAHWSTSGNAPVLDSRDQTVWQGGISAHTQDLFAFGAHIETGTWLSQYIATVATVATRAKDIAYYEGDWSALTSGKWRVDVWPEYGSEEYAADASMPVTALVLRGNGSIWDWIALVKSAACQLYSGGGSASVTIFVDWFAHEKITFEVDQDNFRLAIFVDDVFIGDLPVAGTPASWTYAAGNRLYLHNINNADQTGLRIGQPYPLADPDPDKLLDYRKATFSRGSAASYWDPARRRTYRVGSNQSRILADGSIVIEGARTNQNIWSNSAAFWQVQLNVTLSSDVALMPDAVLDADRIQLALNGYIRRQEPLAEPAGTQYVTSIFHRLASDAASKWQIDLGGVGWVAAIGGDSQEQWSRESGNPPVSVGSPPNALIGPISTDKTAQGGIAAHTQDVLYCGLQIEVGSFASQPIDTVGVAATRAKDVAGYAVGSWDTRLQSGTVWEFVYTPEYPSNAPETFRTQLFSASNGDTIALESVAGQRSLRVRFNGGTKGGDDLRRITFSSWQPITFRVDLVAAEITISGATSGNGLVTIPGGAPLTFGVGSSLSVGHSGTNEQAWGILSQPELIS